MTKVLVTGVGGGVGQSILKSLQGSAYEAIAADAEPLAAGLYAASRSYRIPYASAPRYIERLLEICRSEGVKVLFAGLDTELPILSAAAARFRDAGVIPVVSSPEVVALCDDKLATAEFLQRNEFPAPRTYPLTPDVGRLLAFPMILKPNRGGSRSQGVAVVKSADELSRCLATLDPSRYVAQQWIDGDEYTCGTVSFDGRCFGAIVMRRTLRDGDTYKAFVENDPGLAAFVTKVVEALKPFGPCNVQLRIKDSMPYVFEFNARCSGTTACRALAGFNEPVMVADYLLSGRVPAFKIREIGVLRYWNELVVEPERIARMTRDGVLDGDGKQL